LNPPLPWRFWIDILDVDCIWNGFVMTATIATPIHQINLIPGSAIQINGLSWDDYLAVLEQLEDRRSTRLAYDHGELEIRMPSQRHESINRVLAAIVLTLADEMGFEFNDLGSMTMNRPFLRRGIEPDSCFYIQNAQAGQGLEGAAGEGLAPDLPPDLALEVDIASRSDGKLSIYEAMDVPEVWVYRQGQLSIRWLVMGEYQEREHSRSFPEVTIAQLNQWVTLRETGTDLTVVRAVRLFCRDR
jgi:Uma2 family endonuclease